MTIDVTFDLIDKLQKCIQDLKDEIKDREQTISSLRIQLAANHELGPAPADSRVRVWCMNPLGDGQPRNIYLSGTAIVHFLLRNKGDAKVMKTKLTMNFDYKGTEIDALLLAVSTVAEVFVEAGRPYRITAASRFIDDLFNAENPVMFGEFRRCRIAHAFLDLPHGGGSYRIDAADGIEYGTVIMEKD